MKNKTTFNEYRANIIRYEIQDMLDNLTTTKELDLDEFEKSILKTLNSNEKQLGFVAKSY